MTNQDGRNWEFAPIHGGTPQVRFRDGDPVAGTGWVKDGVMVNEKAEVLGVHPAPLEGGLFDGGPGSGQHIGGVLQPASDQTGVYGDPGVRPPAMGHIATREILNRICGWHGTSR